MTNKELLKIAQKHIGQGGARFRKFCGLPSGAAWCNAYVDYIANEGGVKALYFNGKKETYCPHSMAWCEKNLAQIPLYLAMPMDIIYFDWDKNGVPNHIGFVMAIKDTSSIYTIEGNTNGGVVAQKTRPGKYVCGIFRPHFIAAYKEKALKVDGVFGYQSVGGLQTILKDMGYYKGSINCVLDIATLKAWQKWAGCTPDGCFGTNTAKAIQKKLHIKADGNFGKQSVVAMQRYINANLYKEAEVYKGAFPKLPPKTAKIAVQCAYAYGTKPSKYKYKGGKPKEAYKRLLNKAFPNRKGWKFAKSRAGASCDVFAGTVLRNSGYKNAPHAMSEMVAWCKKHLKSGKTVQNGDILTRTNHVMVAVDLKGKMRVANAHFQDMGGTYGIIQSVSKYTHIWRPTGVSYFSKGDTFTEVKALKKFLNWYGNYGLNENYSFGKVTEDAVKDFQTKEGIEVTGRFGETELKIAKSIKR